MLVAWCTNFVLSTSWMWSGLGTATNPPPPPPPPFGEREILRNQGGYCARTWRVFPRPAPCVPVHKRKNLATGKKKTKLAKDFAKQTASRIYGDPDAKVEGSFERTVCRSRSLKGKLNKKSCFAGDGQRWQLANGPEEKKSSHVI